MLFEELFGKESISQVYAIMLEFLATLAKDDRERIEYILYGKMSSFYLYVNPFTSDDICHLAPYAKNVVKKHKTEMTEFFDSRKLAVDFLHFKVSSISAFFWNKNHVLFCRIMLEQIVGSITTLGSMKICCPSIQSVVNSR